MAAKLLALLTVVLISPLVAPRLRCDATQKLDPGGSWSADRLRAGQWHVLLDDSTNPIVISRCSFATSQGRITCDDLQVDRIVEDVFGGRKYYVFSSQYDLQILPGNSFVENNGRESVTLGTCRVI